jgi:hypothetical protein
LYTGTGPTGVLCRVTGNGLAALEAGGMAGGGGVGICRAAASIEDACDEGDGVG